MADLYRGNPRHELRSLHSVSRVLLLCSRTPHSHSKPNPESWARRWTRARPRCRCDGHDHVKQTGAARTTTKDTDGTYVVTNLAPGSYTVKLELSGFTEREARSSSGRGARAGGRGTGRGFVTEQVTVGILRCWTFLRQDRRQRLTGRSGEPAGQRTELREPHDPGHWRDERRERRLGERAVQRQIEPAELSQLRRCRRHLRVGRESRYLNATGSQFRLQTSMESVAEFRVNSGLAPAESGLGLAATSRS